MKLNKFFAVALSILLMSFCFFNVDLGNKTEANALSENYFGYDTIYYFSDSEPTYRDELDSMLTGFHVVYDTHYALTPAQLANYL